MANEQTKMIRDYPPGYDESEEDSYGAMLSDFFSKPMRWFTIMFYLFSIACLILILISAYMFFESDQSQDQIMYAALFTCFFVTMGIMKVMASVMICRYNLKREIKWLEFRIAELTKGTDDK